MTRAEVNGDVLCDPAEELWSQWEELSAVAREVGDRLVAKGDEWKQAHEQNADAARELWSEHQVLMREYEIARARVNVVYARYLVAKYGLNDADIFG